MKPAKRVGGDAVQIDVEAERVHAPGIVADRLQRDAEGASAQI